MANDQTFWTAFGDESLYITVACDDAGKGGLAARVLNHFGVQTSNNIGGSLDGLDIKQMPAMDVIKLSLLEASTRNSLAPYELVMNYDSGRAEFKEVGSYSGGVSHIYYKIQTSTFIEKCAGVMITGGKPLTRRRDTVWESIFNFNKDHPGGKLIFDTTDMVDSCLRDNFSRNAVIVYRDPHLSTAYNDGIDNLYEIDQDNPWDKVIGYAQKIYTRNEALITPDVTINHAGQASVPILIAGEKNLSASKTNPNIGTLFKRPTVPKEIENFTENCWSDYDVIGDYEKGVPVLIPPSLRFVSKYDDMVDNYIGISGVYVIGVDLNQCNGRPISEKKALEEGGNTEKNTQLWVGIDSYENKVFLMQEGVHYIVGYDPNAKAPLTPYIVFGNNARDYDMAKYGMDSEYKIYPHSRVALGATDVISGKGTILPIGGNSGILVKQVWAVVDIEAPTINITDPKGFAKQIADDLQMELKPLIVVDEPPPIGYNGRILKQEQGLQDHDPMTTQNFDDTDVEAAMAEMADGGEGMTMALSFLDEAGVKDLSGVLYKYMNGRSGVSAVYTCGPECEPKIGGYGPSQGIINSISYNYSDSSSYTIAVTEGPRIFDSSVSINAGPAMKRSESISSTGTVIQDLGNGINFKVRIDGLGRECAAINVTSNIIRAGDKVQVTINNNAVEA